MPSTTKRKRPPKGAYVKLNGEITLSEGLELIKGFNAKEDKAWLWILRQKWNIGVVGMSLNVRYGDRTIERYAERVGLSASSVYKCIAAVRGWEEDEEAYEWFITTPDPFTGKPKRWYHVVKALKLDVDLVEYTPTELAFLLIGAMDTNTRLLERANEVARSIEDPRERERLLDMLQAAEDRYTEECEEYVEVHGSSDVGHGDCKGMGVYTLYPIGEDPMNGRRIHADSLERAYLEALARLGYQLTRTEEAGAEDVIKSFATEERKN